MTKEPAYCLADSLFGKVMVRIISYNRDEDNTNSQHNRKCKYVYELQLFVIHFIGFLRILILAVEFKNQANARNQAFLPTLHDRQPNITHH